MTITKYSEKVLIKDDEIWLSGHGWVTPAEYAELKKTPGVYVGEDDLSEEEFNALFEFDEDELKSKLNIDAIRDNISRLKENSPKHSPEDYEEAEEFVNNEQEPLEGQPLTPEYFYKLVKDGRYSDSVRAEFILFAESATDNDIPPNKRGYILFKPGEFAKYPQAVVYMNDLRLINMQWIQAKHPDHEVDDEALEGKYRSIFDEGEFDYDQAYEIAEGKFKTSKGEINNISDELKVKHLRLPSSWQPELVLLQSAEVKKEARTAKKAEREELDRIKQIEIESITVREQLEAHAKKSMSRMKNIELHVDVWKAVETSGGNPSNLKGVIEAYKSLTGEGIDKSVLRDKIRHLKRALNCWRV